MEIRWGREGHGKGIRERGGGDMREEGGEVECNGGLKFVYRGSRFLYS